MNCRTKRFTGYRSERQRLIEKGLLVPNAPERRSGRVLRIGPIVPAMLKTRPLFDPFTKVYLGEVPDQGCSWLPDVWEFPNAGGGPTTKCSEAYLRELRLHQDSHGGMSPREEDAS